MRKIESEMLAAIRSGRNWAGGNTTVTVDSHKADQSIDVTLHGNRIASYSSFGGWKVSLAGWNTNTTKSRLRALLNMTGGTLETRRGALLLNGREIDSAGWHSLA